MPEGQIYTNHAISSLLFHVQVWVVMFAHRKSYTGNPMVVLDLSYDLLFKVICDLQGQIYANHALSLLLWPVEIQFVLPSYRTSWSMNPLAILVLTYDHGAFSAKLGPI